MLLSDSTVPAFLPSADTAYVLSFPYVCRFLLRARSLYSILFPYAAPALPFSQFQVGYGVQIPAMPGPCKELIKRRRSDHRRIICAINGGRVIESDLTLRARLLHRRSQSRVRSHAARARNLIHSESLGSLHRIFHEPLIHAPPARTLSG